MNLPEFLEQDEDELVRIKGHRIGLEDILFFYREGYSPEMILGQFPTIPLFLIYKVIAFYLENPAFVDDYLQREQAAIERQKATAKHGPTVDELRRRLDSVHQVEMS